MPHATLPSPGFQALILCGPGASLDTFTSNLEEFPKALVPIANRPMVWYPIEWCNRMGITDITLITPPKARKATQAVLDLNPNFTVFPKVEICAPEELNENTGTAELFRLKEIHDIITGDFIILPCDIVCELDGLSLLQEWMVLEGGLGAASGGLLAGGKEIPMGIGGEKRGRRGGLSVWYETKVNGNIKKEETDFLATTPLSKPIVASPKDSLRADISQIVWAMPTDTLKDLKTEKGQGKNVPVRHSLLKSFSRVRMRPTSRDAHIYLLPYWVLDFMKRNETFESVSEDVVGWWAKATWQEGLGDKLGLREVLSPSDPQTQQTNGGGNPLSHEVDLCSYITTSISPSLDSADSVRLASRVQTTTSPNTGALILPNTRLTVPPILAYVQPPSESGPLIRRVDNEEQLLNLSLQLAKLPSFDDNSVSSHSPFAHPSKIAAQIAVPKQSHIDMATSLVGPNTTLSERVSIKESVIGTGCSIGMGAKLTKCLLMDGAVVGDFVSLTGCIIGPRGMVKGGPKEDKKKTDLRGCKVTGGFAVEWPTIATDSILGAGGLMDEGEFDDEGFDDEGGEIDM